MLSHPSPFHSATQTLRSGYKRRQRRHQPAQRAVWYEYDAVCVLLLLCFARRWRPTAFPKFLVQLDGMDGLCHTIIPAGMWDLFGLLKLIRYLFNIAHVCTFAYCWLDFSTEPERHPIMEGGMELYWIEMRIQPLPENRSDMKIEHVRYENNIYVHWKI